MRDEASVGHFRAQLPLHIVPSNGPEGEMPWTLSSACCRSTSARPVSGTAARLLVIVAVDPLDRGVLDEADDPLGDFLDLLLRHVQRLA
jgi:hypothetical protein